MKREVWKHKKMYVVVTKEIEAEKEEEAKALEKVSNRKPAPRPKGAPNWTKRAPRKQESSAIEDPQNTTKVVIDEGHAGPQRKGLTKNTFCTIQGQAAGGQ